MSTPLIWVDLETTGLNPIDDKILEIAVIVTTPDLDEISAVSHVISHDLRLHDLAPEVLRMHSQNELLADVRETAIQVSGAEKRILEELQDIGIPEGKCPLAGSTVHFDRSFLRRYMPALEAFPHYRNIDVSSVKELVARWMPDMEYLNSKGKVHRALDDIRDSIRELSYYRSLLFT